MAAPYAAPIYSARYPDFVLFEETLSAARDSYELFWEPLLRREADLKSAVKDLTTLLREALSPAPTPPGTTVTEAALDLESSTLLARALSSSLAEAQQKLVRVRWDIGRAKENHPEGLPERVKMLEDHVRALRLEYFGEA